MARMELYPLSITEIIGGQFNFIDYLLTDKLSIPNNLPPLSREKLAQAIINGGYPELQKKARVPDKSGSNHTFKVVCLKTLKVFIKPKEIITPS